MNRQQIIHQLFQLSSGTLIDWSDWNDPEPEHNPYLPIRLYLIASGEYELFHGLDAIEPEPSIFQDRVFVDSCLFPSTSFDNCSSLFDRLQQELILAENQHSKPELISELLS